MTITRPKTERKDVEGDKRWFLCFYSQLLPKNKFKEELTMSKGVVHKKWPKEVTHRSGAHVL